ncbi:hypothetical protein BDR07DRAFT_1419652 [Suillus spraguei]|nr:hypothetical protein BDR07DRAFT_1419652 [Suillus spraguei]
MDLQRAASHPMLFRKLFDDWALASIAKQLLGETEFKKPGADTEVMTDAELQFFCQGHKVRANLLC